MELVRADILGIKLTLLTPTIWYTERFAPDWYEDAVREARLGQDYQARRREIIFAVCCAESYLLEWVRDDVLQRSFEKLVVYFPPGRKRGVIEKWKEIPKKLKQDNLIPDVPNLSSPEWRGFRTLVEDFRDGLVHARSSRPATQSQGPEANPRPTIEDLKQLTAGWAVKVVAAQIRGLHQAAGTPAPTWLVEP